MQGIFTIFRKEVASFLDSLIAYVVIAIFLTGVGLFFWVFSYNVLEPGSTFARMDPLFTYGPYMFLFLVPAITMRAFSDEKRTGTFEWLTTQPLTDWQIILGKYLAAVFLILLALIPTIDLCHHHIPAGRSSGQSWMEVRHWALMWDCFSSEPSLQLLEYLLQPCQTIKSLPLY